MYMRAIRRVEMDMPGPCLVMGDKVLPCMSVTVSVADRGGVYDLPTFWVAPKLRDGKVSAFVTNVLGSAGSISMCELD